MGVFTLGKFIMINYRDNAENIYHDNVRFLEIKPASEGIELVKGSLEASTLPLLYLTTLKKKAI